MARMLPNLPSSVHIWEVNRTAFHTYREKNPRMKMYRICIDRKPSRDTLTLWREFEKLVRWINDRMGKEAVRLFPTTDEAEGSFEVALLVEPSAIDRFTSLAPEVQKRIRSSFRCKKVSLEAMELAEPPNMLPVANESAEGWTVNGVEMVDILSNG